MAQYSHSLVVRVRDSYFFFFKKLRFLRRSFSRARVSLSLTCMSFKGQQTIEYGTLCLFILEIFFCLVENVESLSLSLSLSLS